MGNESCGNCQCIQQINQLRSQRANNNKEKYQGEPIKPSELSDAESSEIKYQFTQTKQLGDQSNNNNKQLETTGAAPHSVEGDIESFLPLQSFLKSKPQAPEEKSSENSHNYKSKDINKLQIQQGEISVPFSVIKLIMKKQILQQLSKMEPQLQKMNNENSTGWKLQPEGFYVNKSAKGTCMIITETEFYNGWIKPNSFLPQNGGMLITSKGTYQGNFLNGKANGQGDFITIDGSCRYIGNWERGKLTKGKINTKKYSYEGFLKNSKPHGHGILNYQDKDNKLTFKYVGFFIDGKFDGEGKYENSLYTYSGKFKNGKKNGTGTLVRKDLTERKTESSYNSVQGLKLSGQWENDRLKQQKNVERN